MWCSITVAMIKFKSKLMMSLLCSTHVHSLSFNSRLVPMKRWRIKGLPDLSIVFNCSSYKSQRSISIHHKNEEREKSRYWFITKRNECMVWKHLLQQITVEIIINVTFGLGFGNTAFNHIISIERHRITNVTFVDR